MTNIEEIARLRGGDSDRAIAFWECVNTAAQRDLSTYEVLTLLRSQEERASTITPRALALKIESPDQPSPPVSAESPPAPLLLPNESQHSGTARDDRGAETPERTGADVVEISLAQRYDLSCVQAEELYSLLEDMASLSFESSKELSNHIVKHQLGYQYPNISGIVRMEQDGKQWDFAGGFPREMYRIICNELGLRNQGTRARPVGFTPFRDLGMKG